jgi:hypothetical protein
MGRTACTEPQCLYSRAIPLLPCGPYGLYRASVPVQKSYTTTPLWAVRPVQSLRACTRVHFIFTFLPCISCILVEIKLYAIDLHGFPIEFCTISSHLLPCCKCFQSRCFLHHFSLWMCLPCPNGTAYIMCEVWFVFTEEIYFTLNYKLAWKTGYT